MAAVTRFDVHNSQNVISHLQLCAARYCAYTFTPYLSLRRATDSADASLTCSWGLTAYTTERKLIASSRVQSLKGTRTFSDVDARVKRPSFAIPRNTGEQRVKTCECTWQMTAILVIKTEQDVTGLKQVFVKVFHHAPQVALRNVLPPVLCSAQMLRCTMSNVGFLGIGQRGDRLL